MIDIEGRAAAAQATGFWAQPVVRRLAFFLLLAAAWEALFRLQFWPPYLFPSPSGAPRLSGRARLFQHVQDLP